MIVTVVGGGLAGSEATWQMATRDVPVRLYEMRPVRPTLVHKTGQLAELVCSNSLRADKLDNAVGVLKEEMRRLGSLVMRAADATRVPAGSALAVDRDAFAAYITEALHALPGVEIRRQEITWVPDDGPVIVATGPLTSDRLSADIARFTGCEHLYFYDAISPIVLAETLDMDRVFRASRYGRGSEEGDYLNCPFTDAEYAAFYDALVHAEPASVHDFDREQFFEGCLPIEVLAHRGLDTLRFGPMKPVGLVNPRTGRQPHAVVQLRQDNIAGDHYSLVGFQTQLKWGEQARVFRLIPGLEQAEFVRFGLVHRNTYINGPAVLTETFEARARADLWFAGQISGVEGYVESAASGLLAGLNAAARVRGEPTRVAPRTTALGALAYYVSHADPRYYQPSNIAFGLMPPEPCAPELARRRFSGRGSRQERRLAIAHRALADLERWMRETGLANAPSAASPPVDATGSEDRAVGE